METTAWRFSVGPFFLGRGWRSKSGVDGGALTRQVYVESDDAIICERENVEMRRRWVATAGAIFLMVTASGYSYAANGEVRGKRLFANCSDCHAIKIGAPPKVGPNLFGVVGRKLAADPGYKYPASHVAAGRNGYQWTAQTLIQYLESPTQFMRMVGGDGKSVMLHMVLRLPEARDRKDIVSYLKTLRSLR